MFDPRSSHAKFIPYPDALAGRFPELLELIGVDVEILVCRAATSPHPVLVVEVSDQKRGIYWVFVVKFEPDAVHVAGCDRNHFAGDCRVSQVIGPIKPVGFDVDGPTAG